MLLNPDDYRTGFSILPFAIVEFLANPELTLSASSPSLHFVSIQPKAQKACQKINTHVAEPCCITSDPQPFQAVTELSNESNYAVNVLVYYLFIFYKFIYN